MLAVGALICTQQLYCPGDLGSLQQRAQIGKKKQKTAGPLRAIEKKPGALKKALISMQEKGTVVNKIVTVIHTDPVILVTLRDVELPSINNQKRTLKTIIFEKLLAYEAEHVYRFGGTDDSARKYFETIKQQNNLTDDQFNELFARVGKTPEEAFEEFKTSYLAEQMLSFRIKSRLIIPEDDIRADYEAHPQYEAAAYKLKRGTIKKGTMTDTELREFQESGKHAYKVEWGDPYWLEEGDIAENRDFIKTMTPGSYSSLEVVPQGYEVLKLVQKRAEHKKSFDECRNSIIEKLQVPFYKKKMEELEKELLGKYQITYFTQDN